MHTDPTALDRQTRENWEVDTSDAATFSSCPPLSLAAQIDIFKTNLGSTAGPGQALSTCTIIRRSKLFKTVLLKCAASLAAFGRLDRKQTEYVSDIKTMMKFKLVRVFCPTRQNRLSARREESQGKGSPAW